MTFDMDRPILLCQMFCERVYFKLVHMRAVRLAGMEMLQTKIHTTKYFVDQKFQSRKQAESTSGIA